VLRGEVVALEERVGVAIGLDVVAYRSGRLFVGEDFVGVQRAPENLGAALTGVVDLV
jgi:hypothetical protein